MFTVSTTGILFYTPRALPPPKNTVVEQILQDFQIIWMNERIIASKINNNNNKTK